MAGAALIGQFEGLVLEPYDDPAGHATIGIGHLIHRGPVTEQDRQEYASFSKQDAYDLFIADAQRFVDAVNRLVTVPLTQNQFDALVSFSFNVGEGALADSTLLWKLNTGSYSGAAGEFGKWVKADGVTLPGLVARRAAERELFEREDDTDVADLEHLHPVFRKRVLDTGRAVVSGARSTELQKELYDGWVARKPGYNPANPPRTSWHEHGKGLPGGEWAMAVDFAEPYPHGAPGLVFPIAGEPWHAQPSEITEAYRVNGAESRLPPANPPVVVTNAEEIGMKFTYIYNGEDYVYLGVEGFHGHLPFGEFLDRTKKSGDLRDYGKVGKEFHDGVKQLADQLGFIGDV